MNTHYIIKKGWFYTKIAIPLSKSDNNNEVDKTIIFLSDIQASKKIILHKELNNYVIKIIKLRNSDVERFIEIWNEFIKNNREYNFFLKSFNNECNDII